jgi:hypothetical protein
VTREEFREGWNLLVVQPWGRRYSTSVKGDKSTAATQQAFYFKRLERYGGDMWKVTCEILGATRFGRPSMRVYRHGISHIGWTAGQSNRKQ